MRASVDRLWLLGAHRIDKSAPPSDRRNRPRLCPRLLRKRAETDVMGGTGRASESVVTHKYSAFRANARLSAKPTKAVTLRDFHYAA